MSKYLFVTVLLLCFDVFAQQPILVDPNTGKYLGNYNSNPYDPNSISNPFGRYGSVYSPDSIRNPYGRYGNVYQNRQPSNLNAVTPSTMAY